MIDTLAELAEPIHVATLPMLMWPPTTLTTRPHQLRMGDAATVALPGFAQFFGTVAGLGWRLAVGHIPQVTAVVVETPPPPPPPPLRIVNTNVTLDTNRMATLTWTSLGVPLVEHEIRWNIDGGEFTFLDMVSPTVTSHTFLVASIRNGEILGVQIRGVNDIGDGEWSHTAPVTASGLPALPVQPPANLVLVVTAAGFSLSWDAVTETGFEQYRARVRLNNMGAWTEYTTTSLSVTFPHLGSVGDTLNAEVRTETTGGDSAYSATSGTTVPTIVVWSPGNAVNRGSFPSGLASPQGVTWDGTQLIVVDLSGDELWTVADVTQPGNAVNRGSFPSGLAGPQGVTWDGTQLIVVDNTSDELWTVADVTQPGNAVNRGSFPSGLTSPQGVTWDGTQLIVVDNTGDELWTVADVTQPGNAVNRGSFPSGLAGLGGVTWDGTQLIVVDNSGDELWTVADVTQPGNAVNRGSFPSGLATPAGVTWDGTQLIVVDLSGFELWTLAP